MIRNKKELNKFFITFLGGLLAATFVWTSLFHMGFLIAGREFTPLTYPILAALIVVVVLVLRFIVVPIVNLYEDD